MKKNLISVVILVLLIALLGIANTFRTRYQPATTPTPSATATSTVLTDSSPLVANSWIWIETEYEDEDTHIEETIIPATSSKPFILTLSVEKRFILNTDCNTHSGMFIVEGNLIAFGGDLVSTKMYCEGSREQEFVKWLGGAAAYMFTDQETLVFILAEDEGEIVFKKQ